MGHICIKCINNDSLCIAATNFGRVIPAKCSECGEHDLGYSHRILAETIDPVFRKVFGKVSPGNTIFDSPSTRVKSLVEAVEYITDEEFESVHELIDELRALPSSSTRVFYDHELRYLRFTIASRKVRDEAYIEWRSIGESAKHSQRYFNDDAFNFFKRLFANVHRVRAAMHINGVDVEKRAVTTLPVGTKLYRARIAKNSAEAETFYRNPAAELGPPAIGKSGNGRMNASGIPVLYTSLHRETALAELRPALGVDMVSVEFETLRELKILDFSVLENGTAPRLQDFFDPDYFMQRNRAALLRRLHQLITLPVKPDSENEYVMTQMMAEYLAQSHPENFHGIVFKSAQNADEQNVVLFRPLEVAAGPILENQYGVTVVPDSVRSHSTSAIRYTFEDIDPPDSEL